MGDARISMQLSEEQYRVSTYDDNSGINDKAGLAKAGFYFTRIGRNVKCFSCQLEVDTSEVRSLSEVHSLHKEKSPNCSFAGAPELTQKRTKKFVSYDSLRFEKERLETFIDWPVDWLKPEDLAKDGFYYLRTADHCACVFCRGIVGAWENGDTPREEHKRHFPHCPFIKGQPVGNIPLVQSQIISNITPSPEAAPALPLGIDVCGTGKQMPSSCPDKISSKASSLALASIGLPQHTGPKRKDYLSLDTRIRSFVLWPELVKQTPEQLAEAGFFYCGLSDHVRCFHCGNGLRNWETDDDPWVEHARWYPECNFVLLKKGQEFIDKVRRERPPYLRVPPPTKASTSTLARTTITDRELDPLMDLDIIKATLAMGFPATKVRAALRRKLEQTGMPFFSLEPCIEAVLQYMEEETRLALQRSAARDVEDEAVSQQMSKIETLQSRGGREAVPVSSDIVTVASTSAVTSPASSSSSSNSLSSSAGSSSTSPSPGPSTHPDIPPATPSEPMEIDPSPTSQTGDVLTLADRVIGLAEQALNASPIPSSSLALSQVPSSNSSTARSESSPASTPAPSHAPHSTLHSSQSPAQSPDEVKDMDVEKQVTAIKKKPSRAGKPQSSKDLAEELERIRDTHTCKVCMDAEIDMVFLPCSHMVTCSSCALALTQCPICREDIKYAIKPILS